MNLICPECNLTKSASIVTVRLEVCAHCERNGRASYLVPVPDSARLTRRSSSRTARFDALSPDFARRSSSSA